MAEKNSGIRALLRLPQVYDMFQHLVGADRSRKIIVSQYIQPKSGDRILDIGCGTAEILDYLPDTVAYEGFDLNELYIEQAKARYGQRGAFRCQRVSDELISELPAYDTVLAYGILHHLDDEEAKHLFSIAFRSLKQGGKLVTIDPCYKNGQSPLAKFMVSRDRGQNVRDGAAYQALAEGQKFQRVVCQVHDNLLNIPFTHCVLVCSP